MGQGLDAFPANSQVMTMLLVSDATPEYQRIRNLLGLPAALGSYRQGFQYALVSDT